MNSCGAINTLLRECYLSSIAFNVGEQLFIFHIILVWTISVTDPITSALNGLCECIVRCFLSNELEEDHHSTHFLIICSPSAEGPFRKCDLRIV